VRSTPVKFADETHHDAYGNMDHLAHGDDEAERLSSARAGAHPGANATPQYFFNIGSVETFERSLVDAQREIGADPNEYIPVRK
jgi:hypothetical protein